MKHSVAILLLAFAALLEAAGDALVRSGLKTPHAPSRIFWFGAGAAVLFLYGWVLNAPPWEFGRLLGLYVVFFFIAAQLLSWLVFHQPPSQFVLIGGALIVAGGLVIAFSQV